MPTSLRAVVAIFSVLLSAAVTRAAQVQLNGKTFTLPEGFTIEQVAGPPLIDRPVIADFDERGRLYVAESSGTGDNVQKQLKDKPHKILRLEDTHGDGKFDRKTVFVDHVMFPEGTMWYAGSVYVGAPPSIWKYTDTEGRGVADQTAEWFQGKTLTGCANDIHGPYLGPDGWIYWCKGAFAEQRYERPGHKPLVTRAAHIFRCRPDGSRLEPVMTGGMDNPVEVVFSPGGERFFTTTFLQNPAGGHRDGIIHAIYGGIYGKIHDVIDDHPHTSPEVMPVMVHLGPAAACGLVRYEGDSFGKEYEDNLFASSFNLHKVTRHALTPDGATFASKDSDFVVCDSLDFHPTHVMEDADGSLLVIDTGGWYKLCCPTSQIGKPDVLGAIYRVRREGAAKVDDPRGLKLAWGTTGPDQLAKLLDDPRPAVRKRAIQALAEKGEPALEAIQSVAKDGASPRARVNAIWSATRIDAPKARAIARAALKDADETVRQAAAHSASVWRDQEARPALLSLLRGRSAHNRRVAAEALGRLGDPVAVPHLFAALVTPHDRVLDHALTYALIEIDNTEATATGLESENPAVKRSAMIALDQMEHGKLDPPVVAAALDSPNTELRETAAWIAARHPEWGEALASTLRERLEAPNAGPQAAQLENQLASLAKSPAIAELLANEARDAKAGVERRRLALRAMRDSGLKQQPQAWADALSGVLSGADPDLIAEAVQTLRKLPAEKEHAARATEELLQVAAQHDLPPTVRLDALAALPNGAPALSGELFDFVTSRLAPDLPPAGRLEAAQVLGKAKLNTDQLVALTSAVKTAGPLEIERLLAAFDQSGDPAVGRKLLDALSQSKALPAVRPDLLKTRLAKFGPDVQKQAEPLLAKISPDSAKQKQKLDHLLATLPSGDVRRGQLIFNSTKTACATCHAIGYVGGNVGPDLTRVGAIRSERDLLESIVYPSASFVQSFEPMVVRTTGGDVQSGIIRKNDAEEILLITGPNQEVRIAKKEVKEIRPGTVSIMPEGLDQQLSSQGLADLLAFLKACK